MNDPTREDDGSDALDRNPLGGPTGPKCRRKLGSYAMLGVKPLTSETF